jgi:hypothetical protein
MMTTGVATANALSHSCHVRSAFTVVGSRYTRLAVVELLVHFATFRNVDLFRQGLYYLRVGFFTLAAHPREKSTATTTTASKVGVGSGATDHGSPGDVRNGTGPGDQSPHQFGTGAAGGDATASAASIQAQILQWEAAVHELNTPPPPKKDDKSSSSSSSSAAVAPTTESVLATVDGPVALRKNKVALPYYILPAPETEGDVFSFADKSVYPPEIHDRTNHVVVSTMQEFPQRGCFNHGCFSPRRNAIHLITSCALQCLEKTEHCTCAG